MGHFGVKRTLDILDKHFFWPKMKHDVEKICNRCITCKKAKSKVLPHGLYTPLPVPNEPWVEMSMDFVSGLPRSKKARDSIFVVLDRFSNMAHFIPCHKIDDVVHVVELFFKKIVRLHGMPRSIVSNWETIFLNHFWKVLWGKLETKLLFSTSHRPQTDAQTEVVNRTLSQLLRTIVQKNLKNWEDCLSYEFAYNMTVHSSTNCSPFEVVYGFNSLNPMDLIALPIKDQDSLDGKKKAEMVKEIHERVKYKNQQYATHANEGRRQVTFELGDWVWGHMRKERFPTERKSKLAPRGDGPFQVIQRINDNDYKIDLLGKYSVSDTFNVTDLSPYVAGEDSRSNPFEERGDDKNQELKFNQPQAPAQINNPKDALQIPSGPITRSRAQNLKEALIGLIQDILNT